MYLSPDKFEGEREDGIDEEIALINQGGIRTRDKAHERPTRPYRKCYAAGRQFTAEQNARIEVIKKRVEVIEARLRAAGISPTHSGSAGKLDDLGG